MTTRSPFNDDGGIRPDRPYSEEVEVPRGRIGNLVQKLFFRDQYEKEQLLLDLVEDLAQCRTLDELARRCANSLDQALHPDSLHFFARREKRFRLLRTTRSAEGNVLLPANFRIVELAATWREPHQLGALDLDADERGWLRNWGVRWIVPVLHPDPQAGLVGLLFLGNRREGYSTVQRDLLQAVASRVAMEVERHNRAEVDRLRSDRGQGGWLLECPRCGRCFGDDVFYCPDDDATIEPTLLLDRDIGGRYRLEARLGRGGMGAVYRATDLESGTQVAVKLLTGGDKVAQGRFRIEAKAGKKIRHPAVVEVLDYGTIGRYGAFMVMEFVEGRTLRQVLDDDGPFAPADLAPWIDQVLEGVSVAHELGIIHRDLKPENVMLVAAGDGSGDGSEGVRAKVLDFGLAKLRDPDSGPQVALTAAGMVIGTLAYMSPEQLQAEKLDERSDIFSLAVIISEAITGELPFRAENLGQMLQAVARQPFHMDTEGPAQERVFQVLSRALEKKPEDRYASLDAMRAELIPALADCPPFAHRDA